MTFSRRARLAGYCFRFELFISLSPWGVLASFHMQGCLQSWVNRDPTVLFLRLVKSDQLIPVGLFDLGQLGWRCYSSMWWQWISLWDGGWNAMNGRLRLIDVLILRFNMDRDSSRRGRNMVWVEALSLQKVVEVGSLATSHGNTRKIVLDDLIQRLVWVMAWLRFIRPSLTVVTWILTSGILTIDALILQRLTFLIEMLALCASLRWLNWILEQIDVFLDVFMAYLMFQA